MRQSILSIGLSIIRRLLYGCGESDGLGKKESSRDTSTSLAPPSKSEMKREVAISSLDPHPCSQHDDKQSLLLDYGASDTHITLNFSGTGLDNYLGKDYDCNDQGPRGIRSPGGGQYIELIVDGGVAEEDRLQAVTSLTKVIPLINDQSEPSLIRAFLCRSDGESFKSDGSFFAYAPSSSSVDVNLPMVTFNLPRQVNRLYGDMLMLDFVVANFNLTTGKVQVVINEGDTELLKTTLQTKGPFFVEGLEKNKGYMFTLTLVDSDDNPVVVPYGNIERTVRTI